MTNLENSSGERSPPPENKIPQQGYCWGASEILSRRELQEEDIWDCCCLNIENPEELELEFGRSDRNL